MKIGTAKNVRSLNINWVSDRKFVWIQHCYIMSSTFVAIVSDSEKVGISNILTVSILCITRYIRCDFCLLRRNYIFNNLTHLCRVCMYYNSGIAAGKPAMMIFLVKYDSNIIISFSQSFIIIETTIIIVITNNIIIYIIHIYKKKCFYYNNSKLNKTF